MLQDYLQNVCLAIVNQDSAHFKNYISINPGLKEGQARSQYPVPNDFDLYPLPEKFKPVIKQYLKLIQSVYVQGDIDLSFNDSLELVNHLNRAAESQSNWINLSLINCCNELIGIYQVRLKNYPEEELQLEAAAAMSLDELNTTGPNSLEKLASTINKSFKLSLNDKNLDLSQSKRRDIFFFLGALIKIYFKLGNLDLAKSVEKALKGINLNLPNVNTILSSSNQMSKKSMVTYLYYSSLLSLDDADFLSSEAKLIDCLKILSYCESKNSIFLNRQIEKLLIILLPLRLYNKRLAPSSSLWSQFPNLSLIYRDHLFEAIKLGNLAKFNHCLQKYQIIFLKKNLYLLIENLKSLCYLKLVKKTVALLPNPNHIVPLSAFQITFNLSDTVPYSLDSIECILANLIHKNKIKGYLSHANRCIVLSKVQPFPDQVVKDIDAK